MGRTIRPLKDNILVQQDRPEEKLGSLYVPANTRDLYKDVGTVIAVGPGRMTEGGVIVKPSVKAGDRVHFKRRPSSAIAPDWREGDEDDWKDLLVLKDEDIIGLYVDEDPTPSVDSNEDPTPSV